MYSAHLNQLLVNSRVPVGATLLAGAPMYQFYRSDSSGDVSFLELSYCGVLSHSCKSCSSHRLSFGCKLTARPWKRVPFSQERLASDMLAIPYTGKGSCAIAASRRSRGLLLPALARYVPFCAIGQ